MKWGLNVSLKYLPPSAVFSLVHYCVGFSVLDFVFLLSSSVRSNQSSINSAASEHGIHPVCTLTRSCIGTGIRESNRQIVTACSCGDVGMTVWLAVNGEGVVQSRETRSKIINWVSLSNHLATTDGVTTQLLRNTWSSIGLFPVMDATQPAPGGF